MTDVHTPKIRSKNMAAIKSANTKPEIFVFGELRKGRVFFKKHYAVNKINIDVAFPKNKIAIFIDGDFWHGYRFSKLKKRLPKRYWLGKIKKNIKRDREKRAWLKKNGWMILRFWEHEIKKNPEKVMEKIKKYVNIKRSPRRI